MSDYYSEFFTKPKSGFSHQGGEPDSQHCVQCGLTKRYVGRFARGSNGRCALCEAFKEPTFPGEEALLRDIDLKPGERVGVNVSGGKDSLFAWKWLADHLGGENVVAFSHLKTGIVHPLALQNLQNAKEILKSELVLAADDQMLPRFQKNFEAFINHIKPEMVRVAMCAGCRYGITKRLYLEGEKIGITKFVSAASYLELAPFKEDLLKECNCGSTLYGVIRGLAENEAYCFGNNLDIILREDGFRYKGAVSTEKHKVTSFDGYYLYDFDYYFPNRPREAEEVVKRDLKWQRPERSWHFDCMIEPFKDIFYFGLLGYTETDFKLAAMVRHGLLSREEALVQLDMFNQRLRESFEETAKLMDTLGVGHLKGKIEEFYDRSEFFAKE